MPERQNRQVARVVAACSQPHIQHQAALKRKHGATLRRKRCVRSIYRLQRHTLLLPVLACWRLGCAAVRGIACSMQGPMRVTKYRAHVALPASLMQCATASLSFSTTIGW